jgi:imidazole glycerol phosphate synthase subunit HisF
MRISPKWKTDAASAALAASVFHFGEIRIPEAKAELLRAGVCVRPPEESGVAARKGGER